MSKLKPVKHNKPGVLWCGPAVLSSITGQGTAEIHRVLEAVTGRKSVKGVSNRALVQAAHLLGCDVRLVVDYQRDYRGGSESLACNRLKRPTLVQFARDYADTIKNGAVVVQASCHYVALSGRQFVDSTNSTPVPFRKAHGYRRARVASAWVITAGVNAPLVPAPVVRPPADNSLTKAKRLAARHGITVEQHNPGEHWVYPPDGFDCSPESDPYYDEHLAYDNRNTLERVEKYVSLLTPKT